MNTSQIIALLRESAATIDSLLDYIGESNAIRMVGAREAHADARTLLQELDAIATALSKGGAA